MINLRHDTNKLVEAFRLDCPKKMKKTLDFFYFLHTQVYRKKQAISWAIGRVWIDETLTDNEKAYLIFSLGRMYENNEEKEVK